MENNFGPINCFSIDHAKILVSTFYEVRSKFKLILYYVYNHVFKGGYLGFSHLTKLKNIYITEICMGKQYKSSIIKNHKTI